MGESRGKVRVRRIEGKGGREGERREATLRIGIGCWY